MVATIAFVVILYDIFDALESLSTRPNISEEFVEVSVGLAATIAYLVVVFAMARYEVYNNLEGHEVFPVCSGDGSSPLAKHQLSRSEVALALLQQMFDLCIISRTSLRGPLPCIPCDA